MRYEEFEQSLKEVKETLNFPFFFRRFILYPYLNPKLKNVKPIPRGNCMFCDRVEERANPIIVDLCPTCARKVVERNTNDKNIVIKEKVNFNGRCYLCRRPFWILYTMNVRVCQKCLFKYFKRRYEEIKKPVFRRPLPVRTSESSEHNR